MRNLRLEGLAAMIQRIWRGYNVRKDLIKRRKAQMVIARAWKRWKVIENIKVIICISNTHFYYIYF